MHPIARNILAGAVCLAAVCAAAPPAGAQACSELAEGDVLMVNLVGTDPIVRITDVLGTPNLLTNQEAVCTGGTIAFPRSIDFDRDGRMWVSMADGIVRADSREGGAQVQLLAGLTLAPRSVLKQKDGLVFLAHVLIDQQGRISAIDNLNGYSSDFVSVGTVAFPLGLIFDPTPGADELDMLLAASKTSAPPAPAGIYAINQAGGVTGIARNGYIAIPYRLASNDGNLVYVSDIGGTSDPDGGGGPLPAVTRPAQILRVDRSIPFDFQDLPNANPDGRVNQTVIFEGPPLVTPIGIVILEENGSYPDSLLVSDGASGGGSLFRIDFDPAGVIAATATPVAQGDRLGLPWEVKIVPTLDPQPPVRIFVTDTAPLAGDTGVIYIDPDGTSGEYVTGFTTPTALVVDPTAPTELIVADAAVGGTPSLQRVTVATVNTGTATPITSGDLLVEPMGIVVDANGDIIVADRGGQQILRVDGTTGVQTILSDINTPDENFLENPIGVGIDPDGYIQAVDEGNGAEIGPRLIRINPETGKQFCFAEDEISGGFSLVGIQDIIFDFVGDATIFSAQNAFPIVRFVPGPGSLPETTSLEYGAIRHTAIAENRDLLTVDSGDPDPLVTGDGRVLRLDPIIAFFPGDPAVVPGSENLVDPRGIAVEGEVQPNPPTVDSDGDGIFDPEDNCLDTPNSDQADLNVDFLGDACSTSCDIDGEAGDGVPDGVVGVPDFLLLVEQFGNDCDADPELDCSADCEEFPLTDPPTPPDNVVGVPDFLALVPQLGRTTDFAGPLVSFDSSITCPQP